MEVEPVEVPVAGRAPAGTAKSFRPYVPGQVLLMAPDERESVREGDWPSRAGSAATCAADRTAGPHGRSGSVKRLIGPYRSA